MAKILLVEDDDMILEMYQLRFKEAGMEIITAQDGEAGLALAKAEQPDVILLDIMMPKMDGFAVLTQIKKDPKLVKVPVLMLSNLGQKDDIEKGKKLGANDYIVKASLTPAQVVDKVKQFIKS